MCTNLDLEVLTMSREPEGTNLIIHSIFFFSRGIRGRGVKRKEKYLSRVKREFWSSFLYTKQTSCYVESLFRFTRGFSLSLSLVLSELNVSYKLMRPKIFCTEFLFYFIGRFSR